MRNSILFQLAVELMKLRYQYRARNRLRRIAKRLLQRGNPYQQEGICS